MGALQSVFITLFESILERSDPNWVEKGLLRGYFPLHQHWEKIHVQQVKDIFTSSSANVSALSLTGQSFASEGGVLEELLQILVTRPELTLLRLAVVPCPTTSSTASLSSSLEPDTKNHPYRILDAFITQHRPRDYPKLRVEHYLDHTDVAGYWHEVSQLTTENWIQPKKEEESSSTVPSSVSEA